VLRHIFAGGPAAGGHTDAQFLQAHSVAAVLESVQPAHSLRRASTVTEDRCAGVAKPIIDYYKTNVNYEKKSSLTSLVNIITQMLKSLTKSYYYYIDV